MSVLVDTSALLPLLDRSDRDHGAVRQALQDLAARSETLLTTSYTLVEAGALVKRRLGQEAFQRLGETVQSAMSVIWVDEELHGRAWKLAATHGKDGPSLVDCVSFLVMRESQVDTALTLDAHFRDEGFRVLP
jgi:predicted nucleic acid-binding protein